MLGPCRAPVLTARDADAEKLNLPLRQCLGPQVRVIEVRVTGIDDQITGRQTRQEIVNHRIDGWARRNEYHDGARHAEQTHKLSYILRAADVAVLRLLTQRRYFANVLVIASHGKAVIRHVEQQVASHNAEANHADFIALCVHNAALIACSSAANPLPTLAPR